MKIRCDVKNITNELAMKAGLGVDVLLVAELIQNYCRDHSVSPRKNEYSIKQGLLYINGKSIDRVMPLPKKEVFSEKAYYWEGKILASQEIY